MLAYGLVLTEVLLIEIPFVIMLYPDPFVGQSGLFYGFCCSLLFINPIGKEKKSPRGVFNQAVLFSVAILCLYGTFLFLLLSDGSGSDLCSQCKQLACFDFHPYDWIRDGSCDGYWKWVNKKAKAYA